MRLNNAEKILRIFRTKFKMGASISFDSKYRLILDTEVECVSLNPPSAAPKKKERTQRKSKSESEGSDTGSGSDSESDSESGSDSGSESESANKIYTVKITPEITNYIRSYLRKTQFLDEFDLITEIELDDYNHAPGSALVFNSDSVVFNTSNHTLESLGEWEYLPPDNQENASKSKSKSKSKKRRDDDSDDSDTNADREKSGYKTKDDDLPVSEIENILKEKFQEYNKTHEFIIHESKNSFLYLKINSVEIVKA